MDAAQVLCMTLNYQQIVKESNVPWLPLNINIPYQEILEEATDINHLLVPHRDKDRQGGYRHKGWKSLCIHGISAEKTNHFTEYGYKSNDETPYVWTETAKLCPVTTNFFKERYPISNYFRVRFMLLEPGGFISPHVDTEKSSLSPVNIALNHPKGCVFKMEKPGVVPMKPGIVMLLDVSNKHAYINKSEEDRIHIIVHGKPTKEYKELVEKSYASYGS